MGEVNPDGDGDIGHGRNNGGVTLTEDEPLVETRVGPAREDHSTIAPRLLDEPIDDVHAVVCVVDELAELALRVPATTHIDN